ncbi:MAG TPA: hypothetical protein ENO08_00430 [Candidatus Eisenbacteria bacterium]|uniref:Isoprenylcysteine carboxylmethyltransferase family protein n=1 Tax=Eiseniibacteriota bacterium TaxID=2212470 RepID=A0A7V2ATE0_UNCEI|nr:hypothetical protein [Candidatus Eisenbacteria bacterium]
MSVCKKRVIYWLIMTGASVAAGVALDLALHTRAFPLFVRLLGLAGMLIAHVPLKRTGRLLANRGGIEEQWGCTTRLITADIYRCLRHPHHLGVGVFMTSLGLLIGRPWALLIVTVVQWTWIIAFLLLVEERELEEKFGEEFRRYRARVPLLLADPACLLRVLTSPVSGDTGPPERDERRDPVSDDAGPPEQNERRTDE